MFLGPRSWAQPQQQQQPPPPQHVQHSVEGPEGQYGGPGQSIPPQGPGAYGHGDANSAVYDGPRGPQNGPGGPGGPGQAATQPPVPRSTHTPAPSGAAANGAAAQQASGEKRGPVEFNHAISYVNKIKVCLNMPSLCPRFCETSSFMPILPTDFILPARLRCFLSFSLVSCLVHNFLTFAFFSFRTDSRTNPKFTSSFSKSCRLTSANRSRSRRSMHR